MDSSSRSSNFVQHLKNHPVVVIAGFVLLVGGGVLAGQRYLEGVVDPNAVAIRLASDGEFVRLLSVQLRQNPAFVEQVRGKEGPKGDSGERGPAGEPPNLESIVNSLAASEPFIETVSKMLAEEHSERLRGVIGPQGPPGQPGQISLSDSEVPRVVSALVSNKELIDSVVDNLTGPIKPSVMQVPDPNSLSCKTVCNLEFGRADCRGGMVRTILGRNEEVSCDKKVMRGEMLSCYCAPSPKLR